MLGLTSDSQRQDSSELAFSLVSVMLDWLTVAWWWIFWASVAGTWSPSWQWRRRWRTSCSQRSGTLVSASSTNVTFHRSSLWLPCKPTQWRPRCSGQKRATLWWPQTWTLPSGPEAHRRRSATTCHPTTAGVFFLSDSNSLSFPFN